jgi:glutathione S-transferase
MIILHHLNNSRSQRILWLLEELNLPYRVERYQRDAKTNLAPPELRAIHPLGKSPVIQDGDLVLAESGAIVEYLVERHGNGQLVPPRGTPEHVRYLHWLHFAEGTIMLHLVGRLYLTRVGEAARAMQARVEAMIRAELDLVEAELGRSACLAGEAFSAADVQMLFPLEFALYAGLAGEGLVKLREYVARMQSRPAYRRALEVGGPYAFANP